MTSKDIRDTPLDISEIKSVTLRRQLDTVCTEYRRLASQRAEIDKKLSKIKDKIKTVAKAPELSKAKRVDGDMWSLVRMAGRSSLDQKVLKTRLVELGTPVEKVVKAFEDATKTGDDYYQVNKKGEE